MQTENGKLASRHLLKTGIISVFFLMLCLFLYGIPSIFFRTASATAANEASIALKMQVGDWIIRKGTAYESTIISQVSGNPYSHIGVVTEVFPTIRIIHATTDDDPKRLNQVIESSLSEFTDSTLAKAWAVLRPLTLTETERKQIASHAGSLLGTPFLLKDKTENPLYCTTIIADQLPDALQKKLIWQSVRFPGFDGDYLFPKSLIEMNDIKWIYQSDT